MAEFHTCEEYVLAELADAQEELAALYDYLIRLISLLVEHGIDPPDTDKIDIHRMS